MSNTFKAGDRVTVNQEGLDAIAANCTRDTTAGKAYTLTHTGLNAAKLASTPLDVEFIDDVGDSVILHCTDVTLVEA